MCAKPYVEMEDGLTDLRNVTMATAVGAMVVTPPAESRLADGRVSLEVA